MGVVYDFQGSQLGEEVKLFRELKGEDICLLGVDFYLDSVSKLEEITQLEDRQVRWANYRRGRYKNSLRSTLSSRERSSTYFFFLIFSLWWHRGSGPR